MSETEILGDKPIPDDIAAVIQIWKNTKLHTMKQIGVCLIKYTAAKFIEKNQTNEINYLIGYSFYAEDIF